MLLLDEDLERKMITRLIFSLLFLQTLIAKSTLAITRAPSFNLSHFIYPIIHDDFRPQPSLFLKDVLDAISVRQKWNLEDVRVSNLDTKEVRYGNLQGYEISVRFRKIELVFKLWDDEVLKWRKFKKRGDFESLANEISSKAVLDVLKIEGPFELRGGGDDELRLMLPGEGSISEGDDLVRVLLHPSTSFRSP